MPALFSIVDANHITMNNSRFGRVACPAQGSEELDTHIDLARWPIELARVWRLPWRFDYAAFLPSSPSPFLSFAFAFSKLIGLRYPSAEGRRR
jgi:hypothetical protein